MRDFGVELHGVVTPRLVGHAGDRAAVGAGHELEAGRQLGDLVAMAHPDLEHAVALGRGEVGNIPEQRRVAARPHFGVAEFAGVAAFDLAAELLRHGLHAIADAQHRHAEFEHRLGRAVGGVFVDAGVAAGEDHALERAIAGIGAHPVVADVAGVDFAEHMGFAHAAGDQLGDLGAEIEDEDLRVLHGRIQVKKGKRAASRQPVDLTAFIPPGSWALPW